MNSRNFLLLTLSLIGFGANAQTNLLNARTPEEIGVKTAEQLALDNDNPLPYGYVNESRDVLYGKKVWEIIDLDQRFNFPLYYPIEDNLGSERRSLFSVLISAIEAGEITQVYDDSYFRTKKTLDEVKKLFYYQKLNDGGIDIMNMYQGETEENLKARGILTEEEYSTYEVTAGDISQYRVVGYWYFDARQSELKYRLLGIAPVAIDALSKSMDSEEPIELFWIFFPDARQTLHKALAFNGKNSAAPFTFDHLLNSRRFTGHIYKFENVYGDRKIEDYLAENAQLQLLESEKIKSSIRNFEHDMWSY